MSNNGNLTVHIIDWESKTEDSPDDEYIINVFGSTKSGKKICVQVTGFKPYFFVQVDKYWTKGKVKAYMDFLSSKVYYKHKYNIEDCKIIQKHKFDEFNDFKKFKFLKISFKNYSSMRAYKNIIAKTEYKKKLYQIYEADIEPYIRFMHSKDIDSCGWIKIPKSKFSQLKYYANCNYAITVNYKYVYKHDDSTLSKLIIASFDIECTSEDGTFPRADREHDKIIQIGTTFNYLGDANCYYEHIVTLGSCDPIEGVDVESYDKEEQVLLAWKKMILRINPDILTGYNIFLFDYLYMYDRAKYKNIDEEFSKMGRLWEKVCEFRSKELSSSALGKNMLQYFNYNGRVSIDLLKIIQREFKLASYKLDDVSAHFLKEKITNIKENDGYTILECNKIVAISVGNYVTIMYENGLYPNVIEEKYQIVEIGDKYIKIKGIFNHEFFKKYPYYWCQAKDDISPADIFRLQQGTSADRAIIAKYCIQDCRLCNRIMEKLLVLVNYISMANVSSVPLSYIIIRGQTIKTYSMVMKECSKVNFLIPMLNKTESIGYQGATVLNGEYKVHMDAISTLDYASLYPTSMIHRNISHEFLLKDMKYLNLTEKYDFNTINYFTNDGKEVKCIFASPKDGTLGIIPNILKKLMDKRNEMKKKAASENDPFLKSVYDAMNLAYKLSANSVYGQTGASISPIYKLEVAASTTSTGREMLHIARVYVAHIFPILLECVKINNYEMYTTKLKQLYDKKFDEMLGEKNVELLKNTYYQDIIDDDKDNDNFEQYYFDKEGKLTKNNEKKNNAGIMNDYYYLRVLHERKNKTIFDDKFANSSFEILKNTLDGLTTAPYCVYGDTDSVMINFKFEKNNERYDGEDKVAKNIAVATIASDIINQLLPEPHNLEYEKTFYPYILLSKKRYVGNKYENDPKKFVQNSMGIVLKRRDNAPIVKVVVDGIVKMILNEHSIEKAIQYCKEQLKMILSEKHDIKLFVITKSLKGPGMDKNDRLIENSKPKDDRFYKERSRIVHAALADRMADRDPGNKLQSGERVPYVFVQVNGNCKLQADRVENLQYVIDNKLKLDYVYYIEKQIMNPSIQFLACMTNNPEKIFNDFITRGKNFRNGIKPINYYFNKSDETKSEMNYDKYNLDKVVGVKTKTKKKNVPKKKNDNVNKVNLKINDFKFNFD